MKKVNEVMARFWIWVLGCFYGTSIRTRERFGAVIAWDSLVGNSETPPCGADESAALLPRLD